MPFALLAVLLTSQASPILGLTRRSGGGILGLGRSARRSLAPETLGTWMIGSPGRCTLLGQSPDALKALGYAFEERAAIHEYDAGLPREEAEHVAWEHVQREWRALLGSARTRSRGPTEHWKPMKHERNEQ